MSYNTGVYKHRSLELEALDCGHNVKAVPTDDNFLEATFTASATRVVGVGECVGMLRIPANTVVLGAELYWDDTAPAAMIAIGDPFACGRFLGPVLTTHARGRMSSALPTCSPWGTCGTMNKMGVEGDGCGFHYRFTCETDLLLTNLYHNNLAQMGGWRGGTAAAAAGADGADGQASTAITAGTYKLFLHVKKAARVTP